jgi:hypothetical protein
MDNIIQYDDFWSAILVIFNRDKTAVIVNKNRDIHSFTEDRWLLPEIENYVKSWSPSETVVKMAKYYYNLDLKKQDIECLCTTLGDDSYPVHLFATKRYNDQIKDLFVSCTSETDKHILFLDQISLSDSGLSGFHREILIEDAKLVEPKASPLREINLRVAYKKKDLKSKMSNFSPKPL